MQLTGAESINAKNVQFSLVSTELNGRMHNKQQHWDANSVVQLFDRPHAKRYANAKVHCLVVQQ